MHHATTTSISNLRSQFVFRTLKRPTMSDQKQHEDECMVDEISNLPDCILHHVLSFMSTKEAVKTSILSTRWNNVWASVPNVDFDDALLYASEVDARPPPEITSFMNFVEKVLKFRDSSNIEKFRLSCRVCFEASRIDSWISNAVMRNVRDLDLSLIADEPSVLPQSIFDSKFLVSLKIEMNCVINLPSHISLPRLNTLHLSLVTFPNDDLTEKLFSGCTVLEQLVLLDCEWVKLKNITISSSTLKSLTIDDDDLSYFEPLDDLGGCKINIDAANLTYFEYIGFLANEIFLKNVSSLTKACIHIPFSYERQKEVVSRSVNLLEGLQSVASLRVSNRTIESLIFAENIVDPLPVFSKLKHLGLRTEMGNRTVRALMDLLNFCPNLQSICLCKGFERCLHLGENDPIWSSIPICISYCLKKVTFKNFNATDSEICFLKSVLKYAHALEKMDIWWCEAQIRNVKKQRDVKKEFEMMETSSTTCLVRFL